MLAGVLTILFSAFGVPLLVTDPARVDFCMGMYCGIGTALHTPTFRVDERCLLPGVALQCLAALALLKEE